MEKAVDRETSQELCHREGVPGREYPNIINTGDARGLLKPVLDDL